jgi:tetratricopeptide (TPR) repeat protein
MKCPFCNSDQSSKTDEEMVAEVMKRVEANDTDSMFLLANYYYQGRAGLQQDHAKAIEKYATAAELGSNAAHYCLGMHYKVQGDLKKARFHFGEAHNNLAGVYHQGGDKKKAKFFYEAAAMLGQEVARYNLGCMEAQSRNMEQAVKHWNIAASAGCFHSMDALRMSFPRGFVSRESIQSTLTAYNNSCAEMRSKDGDACISPQESHVKPTNSSSPSLQRSAEMYQRQSKKIGTGSTPESQMKVSLQATAFEVETAKHNTPSNFNNANNHQMMTRRREAILKFKDFHSGSIKPKVTTTTTVQKSKYLSDKKSVTFNSTETTMDLYGNSTETTMDLYGVSQSMSDLTLSMSEESSSPKSI